MNNTTISYEDFWQDGVLQIENDSEAPFCISHIQIELIANTYEVSIINNVLDRKVKIVAGDFILEYHEAKRKADKLAELLNLEVTYVDEKYTHYLKSGFNGIYYKDQSNTVCTSNIRKCIDHKVKYNDREIYVNIYTKTGLPTFNYLTMKEMFGYDLENDFQGVELDHLIHFANLSDDIDTKKEVIRFIDFLIKTFNINSPYYKFVINEFKEKGIA